ncbi:NAD(P)/FAD-dependent oxidoreductase [Sphingobacterium sp. SGG-5]|uniref:NAD(P)/FAD-dependent oxidoreductase n=1 Tax=Sphingobacterium sp. SGG-5 TaxID=2710881 RepID=UPI0013EC5F7C|nr:NAD(P)/FAD-dependent oxidoreductase [Sphingobacterium sp. SGG-5]NGM61722.1 NAD(P)/FAD-dependent oxidoreductase [Sphingobacterium sp. SGG-5]
MADNKNFEVIIVGGSYAGLSAAMALGRSLRHVLIIDSGLPCNRQTPHSHNFLTQDGKTPKEISTLAKKQVEKYKTVKFHNGRATGGLKSADGFEITTDTEDKFTAKKLIFATGLKDLMPDIKGFAACWGISIIHCPYCHGFEYRNQNTGIIANGAKAFHLASLVYNLTKNVTILTNGKADLDVEQITRLNEHSIKIIETNIAEVEHTNGQLKNVIFDDGSKLNFNAIYAAIPFRQHSDIPLSLGCEITEQGYIRVDDLQKTTVENVFACGDNSGMMRSVANAVYSGNLTGAMVNSLLSAAEF